MKIIRYIKLKNPIGNEWVAELNIGWQKYEEKEEGGIISRKAIGDPQVLKNPKDICVGSELTVDIKKTKIPNRAEVWLKPVINLGKDGPDSEHFIYDEKTGETASFSIKGELASKKTLTALDK